MAISISLETDSHLKRQLQEHLTTRLPEWFGQPESNRKFAAQAEVLPGYIARVDGVPKGMLLLKKHSDISAEIYWLAVDRDCHRAGLGRALIEIGCQKAQAEKAKFLFVYTLHPGVNYEPYKRTGLFYEAMGFHYVLEEQIADEVNPLALYMKCLSR